MLIQRLVLMRDFDSHPSEKYFDHYYYIKVGDKIVYVYLIPFILRLSFVIFGDGTLGMYLSTSAPLLSLNYLSPDMTCSINKYVVESDTIRLLNLTRFKNYRIRITLLGEHYFPIYYRGDVYFVPGCAYEAYVVINNVPICDVVIIYEYFTCSIYDYVIELV